MRLGHLAAVASRSIARHSASLAQDHPSQPNEHFDIADPRRVNNSKRIYIVDVATEGNSLLSAGRSGDDAARQPGERETRYADSQTDSRDGGTPGNTGRQRGGEGDGRREPLPLFFLQVHTAAEERLNIDEVEQCIAERCGFHNLENSSMCTNGEEVHRAVQYLRLGKTTGSDGLLAESLRIVADTDSRMCAALVWNLKRRLDNASAAMHRHKLRAPCSQPHLSVRFNTVEGKHAPIHA